jgi:hypothetical protein
VQRWTLRRVVVALGAAFVIVLLALNSARLFNNDDDVRTPVEVDALCGNMEPMWLQAQAVPTASLVPCVAASPIGWSFRVLTVNNGRSTITVNHDRAGAEAIDLSFAESCDVTGASEVGADVPGARRFERHPLPGNNTILTWYEVFPGGCTTATLSSRNPAREVRDDVSAQAATVIGFVRRTDLAQALDQRSDGRLRLDPPA